MKSTLSADEFEHTGEVLAPWMESTLRSVTIAALFGDTMARSLGMAPLGLRENAGLAWAMHAAECAT